MNWSKLPSLSALRAFEAAARHVNYSKAGRELNVSHVAIGQQVRRLEAHLGLRLIARAGRGVELTEAGARLAQDLHQGFLTIAEGVSALQEAEEHRPLMVTMTPSFAVSWFMPRLHLFREKHPEIELRIDPTPKLVDLAAGEFDVAIRFGDGNWPGLEVTPLIRSSFVIAGAPALLEGRTIAQPQDLLDLPWLQENETDEVATWLAGRGITNFGAMNVTRMPGYMVLSALRQGQGIAATARLFIEEDIARGTLVPLFEDDVDTPTSYHLVCRPGLKRPALKQFLKWMNSVV